ncbi:very long chain fatty acid elongase 7 [Parasteatoda tepidariorum]|uniref:very long chain fatty acid elongase 7 n=1 Tax=Parasteatoda tepidariorum TaxID=114398 RepID=UPI00077FA7F2|nr:elongation of very long chain fatty acids protein 7 [Parasteatoda tepidariorum]XP_015916239.1 elongation of very long chain fatty acids protein 7 [Parasteatoda tepidariorum]XP_015916240.1 elongation of very long chain fatty acids protein 7 [Parasteatoda tepidariorum]XP_015916241.1 elongation of very long chain fatty acids protein 7 [Parasteatoda tepidariorum]XP_042903945.1 elongation of very long chain fatty acids protein 7 [Parasteatoda tepidariorum]
MANLVERRAFNIMGIFDSLGEHLNTGDPVVKEWFLVKSNFWPIFLSSMYLLIVKVIGPSIMRDRKPFELRILMMVYNLFLVATYTVTVSTVLYCIRQVDSSVLCKDTVVIYGTCTYTMAACGWIIYMLKYVEFLDTIFFVLRKKDNLITNLHVIHHCVLPLCGWVFFRTERSGFQAYPIIINSVVHIAMYGYYGLAAMGPGVRKYLWWKRYLTIAQMIQFILILFFVMVVMPVSGCTAAKSSIYINVVAATLFFALFYNFYQHTFKPTKSKTNGVHKKREIEDKKEENGNIHTEMSYNETYTNGNSKVKCN